MANWCKILSTVLLCGSIAFAQFDDESSEESYSYGASEAEADDAFADNDGEEQETKVGEAKASGDEWQGFNYEEMGLTQWEFQQAKEPNTFKSRGKSSVFLKKNGLPSVLAVSKMQTSTAPTATVLAIKATHISLCWFLPSISGKRTSP